MEGKHTATPKLVFTLGGVVVKSAEEARVIRRRAVRLGQEWLLHQCDSVIRQFLAKAGAA